jgi:phosphatidylserine decarboxylase
VILVGAIFVGSIETVWHDEVRAGRAEPTRWVYRGEQRHAFETGAEIGRFNMGSTVILLLPRDRVAWNPDLTPGSAVRMGESLGRPGTPLPNH